MSDVDLRQMAGERFEQELDAAWKAKDFSKALALSRELLTLREESLGPEHAAVVSTLCDMAELHRRLGAPEDAERLLTRAFEAQHKRGPGEQLGRVAFQLAQVLLERGAADAALPFIEQAAAMAGPVEQVVAYGSLATVLRSLGRIPEARKAADQALVACDPKRTAPIDAAQAHNLAAELCEEAGELADARSLYLAAHDLYVLALGDKHPQVGIALLNVITVDHLRGKDVRQGAQEVMAILSQSVGPLHEQTQAVQRALEAMLNLPMGQWS